MILWAVGTEEKIYIEIKINSDSSYMPVFRSKAAADDFAVKNDLGSRFNAQEFTFESYDYSNSLSAKHGHVLYLRVLD